MVYFKRSPVGGDTNPGSGPWAVSAPATYHVLVRHFALHPVG
ncbi:MAG: hypothetical protein ACTHKY_12090 [Ginsengibacter sp.]